jgi:hypothetical protein
MTTEAIAEYARQLYNLMDSLAKENEYHERVFTGSITDLYKDIGASTSYYTAIRKFLLDAELITILQRGNAKQQSQVRLNELSENILRKPLTAAPRAATMGADVQRRLERLEAWRETTGGLNIAEALRNIEDRVTRLEGNSDSDSVTGGKN